MQTLTDLAKWRALRRSWPQAPIALVPTMGNLHAGHLALVQLARQQVSRVVVSIFVNPLQFGVGEDYAHYPRTLEADAALLAQAGVDVLLVPTVAAMYPQGAQNLTHIQPPAALTETLCGLHRPRHFTGVATVVVKLFNLVQPDVAVFGAKDWQQLQVIRRLVTDLDFPLEIVAVPTVREADGLALSSRNGYLTAEERRLAPQLYQMLCLLAQRLQSGIGDYLQLEAEGGALLRQAGFEPEYVSIRTPDTLTLPPAQAAQLIILAAARLGKTRLIDNLRLQR